MNEIANANEQNHLSLLDSYAAQARMLTENIALNMLQLGHVFTEAKRLVEHGQWAGWVQDNCGMSERYAQQFIQAYARYGENEQYARLGKTKLIRLLALPEGEEERFMAEHDVEAMSTREVDEAVKAERAQWQKKLDAANRAREEAEKQLSFLQTKEPEIPEEFYQNMKAKDEQIARQKLAMEQMAEQQRQMIEDSGQHTAELNGLKRENALLRQENSDQNAMLRDIQTDLEHAQQELLNAKSDLARGDAERMPADQLTIDVFAGAVRQFIGTCARMPQMRRVFSTMSYQEKQEYETLLATVEEWAKGSRQALDSIASEGSVA